MMEMPCFEVELSIAPNAEASIEDGELEATADVVLEAVRSKAAFLALGAVVSLDLSTNAIEVFCNVAAETPDDLHAKVAKIFDVMLESANDFEYQSSSTQRLELVPA